MDRTAGFATAIGISEEVLQSLIRVLYSAGQIDPVISLATGPLAATLFQDAPGISLAANAEGRVTFTLSAWGAIAITPPGGTRDARQVTVTASVSVPLSTSVTGSGVALQIVSGSAMLVDLAIVPFIGLPFTAATQAYIDSADFKALVTLGLQLELAALAQSIPPLGLSLLTPGLDATNSSASLAVLDHLLILGVDLIGGDVTTAGNAALLTDFTRGADLSVWMSPVAIPVSYGFIEDQFKTAVTASGATFESFSVAVEEGGLRIRGAASDSGVTVHFSLLAVPSLLHVWTEMVSSELDDEVEGGPHPVVHHDHVLWFDAQDVSADSDRSWTEALEETLLGIITFGVGPIVIENIIDGILAQGKGQLVTGVEDATVSLQQQLMLPGISSPPIFLHLDAYECHADGVYIGMTYSAQLEGGQLVTPGDSVSVEEALAHGVSYRLVLSQGALSSDLALHVRWTVRNALDNTVIYTVDGTAQMELQLNLTTATVPFLQDSKFTIECRAYRPLGNNVTEIFDATANLQIVDRLDRSHPFVQWTHQAYSPLVQTFPDGSTHTIGVTLNTRHSRIHRTVLPGRCRMASRYSLAWDGPVDEQPVPALVYLDELPFPTADLLSHRREVCDYCFFGGPTSDVPLI